MPKATYADVLVRADREIEQVSDLACDVAVNYGQMFANVRHMRWFRQAVAQELINSSPRFHHLTQETES